MAVLQAPELFSQPVKWTLSTKRAERVHLPGVPSRDDVIT
jgi:hypothetical protein